MRNARDLQLRTYIFSISYGSLSEQALSQAESRFNRHEPIDDEVHITSACKPVVLLENCCKHFCASHKPKI